EALAKQAESHAEFRYVRANGDITWVQGHAVPLRDANGRHIGYIGTVADISKDFNGIITSWNHGAERIFGYAANEVIDKPITILIPDDRLHEEVDIISRIRRGEPIEHCETVRRCKDGRLINIALTFSSIRDARGRIIGASKIARDITQRKCDEERQRVLYQ